MQEKLKSFYSIITQVISINWYRGEFLKFRDKIRFYHLSCPNWGKLVFPELVIMQAILLTVCQMILIKFVWRIWYRINQ